MNKKITLLVVAIIVIIGLAILFKNDIKPYSVMGDKNIPTTETSQASNEVVVDNFSFSPETLTVTAGTKVVWKEKDQAVHTIISDNGLFSSEELKTGDEFSFTFTEAGEYGYYCSIHPSMRGKIIVAPIN